MKTITIMLFVLFLSIGILIGVLIAASKQKKQLQPTKIYLEIIKRDTNTSGPGYWYTIAHLNNGRYDTLPNVFSIQKYVIGFDKFIITPEK